MIAEWLQQYEPKNNQQAEQALREILQEISLAGLARKGFFELAAFYGGTALRILHQLPRFSENLDFSLLSKTPGFSLHPYLDGIVEQCEALGMQVSITEKQKSIKTNVDSAFLKADTIWKELILKAIIPQEITSIRPQLKIKIEIDTNPPQNFSTEEKLLLRPYSFYVKCFTLPDLFAGKVHALLFRKWKDRVKGRDWFDFEWYVRKGVPLHLEHLKTRAENSGDWKEKTLNRKSLISLLDNKIDNLSFNRVKEDIAKFIPDPQVLDIWSPAYFHDLVQKLKTT